MDDLIAFIEARLARLEDDARQALDATPVSNPRYPAGGPMISSAVARSLYGARYGPGHGLREVAALRAIIDATFLYEASLDSELDCCHSAQEIRDGKCPDTKVASIGTLRHIAAIWITHPDYRQEWKP